MPMAFFIAASRSVYSRSNSASSSRSAIYRSRRLSASSRVFCLSVTIRPGRRFTASSNAARATR